MTPEMLHNIIRKTRFIAIRQTRIIERIGIRIGVGKIKELSNSLNTP